MTFVSLSWLFTVQGSLLVLSVGLLFLGYFSMFGGGVFMGLSLSLFLVYISVNEVLGDDLVYSLSMQISYECGFENFEIASESYSIQFFIVGLSFMLFDLEICMFMPVVYASWGFGSVFLGGYIFLMLVLFVYLYEIQNGVLGW